MHAARCASIEIYGLWVFQHHSANRILTVMSDVGVTALRAHMTDTTGLEVRGGPARFTQYVEQLDSALDRLIENYEIQILDLSAWTAKKLEFGDACRV